MLVFSIIPLAVKIKYFTYTLKGEILRGKNLEIPFLLDFYGEMLTQKQHDCLVYYYEEDLSLSEIAENEGISRQGVRDSIKRAEAQLFDMEERLGLAKRFNEMKRELTKSLNVLIISTNITSIIHFLWKLMIMLQELKHSLLFLKKDNIY